MTDSIKAAIGAAWTALNAYQDRFGSSMPNDQRAHRDRNLVGPIDAEMTALRAALKATLVEAPAK